jgi:hypothetical protein
VKPAGKDCGLHVTGDLGCSCIAANDRSRTKALRVRQAGNPNTPPICDDHIQSGPRWCASPRVALAVRLRYRGTDMLYFRRSSPFSQDRSVFPAGSSGVFGASRGTLYVISTGHFPYGREAVAPYSPSGELLRDTATGQPLWEMTLFAAALDAAQGERWLEESPWDDSRRRRTQGCRLQASGRLTGVHPQLDDGVRERIATRLAVPTMKLFSGARMWTNDWKMRGEAIVAVLSVIPIQTSLLDRLLAAGAVSALWSSRHPQRWDADRETWVVAPLTGSECSEHPGLSARRGRSPPPTKSPDAAIGDGVIASES